MFFARKARREGLELQLTAMIDIFTIIVIFLIKGTVMGAADLEIPKETKLPKSFSAETIEISTQLVITPEQVSVSNLSKDIPKTEPIKLSEFKQGREVETPAVKQLSDLLKSELAKRTAEDRKGGILLSVVADQKTPYADIFDVVRVFRSAGFETLLFIAMNEIKKEGGDKK
jgi:biopolymer transport protein ExbD